MESEATFLGIDLGAESLRTFAGRMAGGVLRIEGISRVQNCPVELEGHLHWNIGRIEEEVLKGLRVAGRLGISVQSLGIDTWGVDFGLFDSGGNLLMPPFAYRDDRNLAAMREFLRIFPARRLYELTGIQIMPFNSVFQLYAYRKQNPDVIEKAEHLLFMPDIFNNLLAGARLTEFTFATTSQLRNPFTGEWEPEIFDALGVPVDLMNEVVPPGTAIGALKPGLARDAGIGECQVVAVGSHDTASAVAAVPASADDWAYISSGTWSLIGTEIDRPLINDASFSSNFTNEGGVGGRYRFLKNVCGLWLLRRLRDEWAEGGKEFAYEELIELGSVAPPFKAVIDPDDGAFLNPPSMSGAIVEYCLRTDQCPPSTEGEFARIVMESLALAYRDVIEQLEGFFPGKIKRIHVVGGGARNELLNRFTADATGLPVSAGPHEATVVGNIMVQALALGMVNDLEGLREAVRRSFEVSEHMPGDGRRWDRALEKYRSLKETGEGSF